LEGKRNRGKLMDHRVNMKKYTGEERFEQEVNKRK